MNDPENYDGTPLTDDEIAAHREAIEHIDAQLEGYVGDSGVWGELTRELAHLIDELAAGRYLPLPLPEDEEV